MTEDEMIEQIHELYLDIHNKHKESYEIQGKINEFRILFEKLNFSLNCVLHLKDVDKEELLQYCKELTEKGLKL